MTSSTDDVRITSFEPLTTPAALIHDLPCTAELAAVVAGARERLQTILRGKDDRLVVVIGPCSIHDRAAALEYAERLAAIREGLADTLEIVMRVYFEKPRTTIGWKGLINDPLLDGSCRINDGLRLARQILCAINALGVPAGCEYLDTISPQYLSDLVTWGAIGARTTESQIHRQMASGLSCPVGFKNSTDGNIQVAIDAVGAAAHPHHFMAVTKDGRAAVATTAGNPDCHVILRGGKTPNHDGAHIEMTHALLEKAHLPPRIMVDASHANSGKKPENQPLVVNSLANRIAAGDRRIVGLMIESHLVGGRQQIIPGKALTYGQSVTDGCLDWDVSCELLDRLAAAVRARRVVQRAGAVA